MSDPLDGGRDGAGSLDRSDPRAADPELSSGKAPDATRMDQNVASGDERLEGLLVQVRADVADRSDEDVEYMLRTRLRDLQLDLSDDEIAGLVDRVRSR